MTTENDSPIQVLKNEKQETFRLMYCIAWIDDQLTQLILDSGLSESVMMKAFMNKLRQKAD